MGKFSVAIDGPAGAGKSTIAKEIAKKLKCTYIDTGAMYRAVGFYCLDQGIALDDEQSVCSEKENMDIQLIYQNDSQVILLNGQDITEVIRTQEVATSASKVAVYSEIREALVDMQRNFAKTSNVVMDGRDIGTVVLPHATLKIFLTASSEERAMRRVKEYEDKGISADYNSILKEIQERDIQDSSRKVSPLKKADDAINIDTTKLTIPEIVEQIIVLIKQRMEEEYKL